MFHLIASIFELALIAYVVWVSISLVKYFSNKEKELWDVDSENDKAEQQLVQSLLLPVKVYDYLKLKFISILEKYGLL